MTLSPHTSSSPSCLCPYAQNTHLQQLPCDFNEFPNSDPELRTVYCKVCGQKNKLNFKSPAPEATVSPYAVLLFGSLVFIWYITLFRVPTRPVSPPSILPSPSQTNPDR
jgi:hypothetical protein